MLLKFIINNLKYLGMQTKNSIQLLSFISLIILLFRVLIIILNLFLKSTQVSFKQATNGELSKIFENIPLKKMRFSYEYLNIYSAFSPHNSTILGSHYHSELIFQIYPSISFRQRRSICQKSLKMFFSWNLSICHNQLEFLILTHCICNINRKFSSTRFTEIMILF